jgi:hypothetical protein
MRSRTPASLRGRLERNLLAYATAASAAGVGALALPAEAKVIYTPMHVDASFYHLDLNNDGVTDFLFSVTSSCESNCVKTFVISGNSGAVRHSTRSGYAAALRAGAHIGPKKQFEKSYARLIEVIASSSSTYGRGPWVNVKKRYLGLKFRVGADIHYGWARLNVRLDG